MSHSVNSVSLLGNFFFPRYLVWSRQTMVLLRVLLHLLPDTPLLQVLTDSPVTSSRLLRMPLLPHPFLSFHHPLLVLIHDWAARLNRILFSFHHRDSSD